jgi:ABC-type Fe3+-siderophore transport system permease subunit
VKEGIKTPLKKSVIFCVASVALGIAVFDGPLSLIPIVTAVMVTFATAQDNPVIIRSAYTVANIMWIFFNFMSRAYVSAVYSAIELIVSFVAVIVFINRAKSKRTENSEE